MSGAGKKYARKGRRHDATGRSLGRRKFTIPTPFVWQTAEMKMSPAWRTLSLSARRVLDRLEIEMANHAGKDNGKLLCTYDHFVEYGIADRNSVASAIRECEALGFLRVKRGRAGNADSKTPSLYRLTFRETDEADPSDEWRRIHTIEEAEAKARAARREKPKRRRRNKRKAANSDGQKTDSQYGKTTPAPVWKNHTKGPACSVPSPVWKNHTADIYPSALNAATLDRAVATDTG